MHAAVSLKETNELMNNFDLTRVEAVRVARFAKFHGLATIEIVNTLYGDPDEVTYDKLIRNCEHLIGRT